MNATTATSSLTRELDHRISDGIEVRLLWRPHDDAVIVAVLDGRTGEGFSIVVEDGERALDIFHHPYAYAAARPALAAVAA
jgi:hypothetical protein